MEQLLNKDENDLAQTPLEHDVVRKLQTYYKSCLRWDIIDKRGFGPIVELGNDIFKMASKSGVTLPRMLSELNLQAIYPFFKIIYTKIEGRGFGDLELEMYPAYGFKVKKETIWGVLKMFEEADVFKFKKSSEFDDIVEWVYQLEMQQVKFVKSQNIVMNDRVTFEAQSVKISEFNEKTDLDWNEYLGGLNLTGIKKVHLWGDVDQFEAAFYAIGKMKADDLKYFFLWRLAAAHFNKLAESFWNLWTNDIWANVVVSYYEDGEIRNQVFQTDCVTELGMHLNFLSGYLGIAKELVEDLMASAKKSLAHLNWMDEDTKESALKKIDTMEKVIGYPDWLANGDEVAEYYSSIDFEKLKYFENAVSAQAFSDIYPSIYQLQKELDVKDTDKNPLRRDSIFFGYPWQLNAFHLTDLNSMQINPGILQRPLFSALNPAVMNYGGLGTIIGHEITHAFDSLGRKINYNGELAPWWSNAANDSFTFGAQCFVDQYNKLSVTLKTGELAYCNGEQSLPENIADNGGLDLAIEAWRAYLLRKHGESKYRKEWGQSELPGFNGLTEEQVWCAVQNDLDVLSLIDSDVHAPNPIRVRGVLQNSADFQRAFSCKVGDKY
ncbi:Endothelin-converting enzyme 2, partial [Nowakowskiella sp. JEL0078]